MTDRPDDTPRPPEKDAVAEPVIYLVVWSTIARQQGGSIDGYTAGTFAAT